MKVICRHGHFSFYPEKPGEIVRFNNVFGVELVPENDYYTFPALLNAPDYSIETVPYLGQPALVTYEGKPWEVMRENGFVYSFSSRTLVRKDTIIDSVEPIFTGLFYVIRDRLLQPGSFDKSGRRIMSYDGFFREEIGQLRILRFDYV